jgi:hypothetical protein
MPGGTSRNFVRTKLRPPGYMQLIAKAIICPGIVMAIPGTGSELPNVGFSSIEQALKSFPGFRRNECGGVKRYG